MGLAAAAFDCLSLLSGSTAGLDTVRVIAACLVATEIWLLAANDYAIIAADELENGSGASITQTRCCQAHDARITAGTIFEAASQLIE